MSTPRAMGSAKKRGHQHHPRNDGTRRRVALDVTANTFLSKYSTNNVAVQNSTITNQNITINNSVSPKNILTLNETKLQTQNNTNNCDIEVIDLTNCDDDIVNIRKEFNSNEFKDDKCKEAVSKKRERR
ncbi:hypothetical protein NQ314_013210 [Rhamnusium bicolor]|uniref:Uncharacterized protein n=1 Tax=Rhamnusium bicolor TaxID=1586634 RepID=A0AAV8X733_9CUCU|nr:hypothetical protein NQ314_013210 [Rhamnusium bicolor]